MDLKDFRATLEHILARTNPETDLYVFSNLSMDTLDYSGPEVNKGSKGVWLGLGDPVRELPRVFSAAELPRGRWRRPGVLRRLPRRRARRRTRANPAPRSVSLPIRAFAGWPLVVLTDEPTRATKSPMNFLWTTFTRFEPAADIHAGATRVVRHHLAYSAPIVIDARMKPWYPRELGCRDDVAATVTERWREYFPGRNVEMGDSERGHLD